MSRPTVCDIPIPHGEYNGFRLFEYRMRYYGVPTDFVRLPRIEVERTFGHPAVLVSPTRGGLETLVDSFDPAPFRRESAGEYEDYDIVRHGETYYGLPRALGELDPNLEEDRARDGVVCGDTRDEVVARIRDGRTACRVEFAGWLPVFARFGDCGNHPQFGHKQAPPPGYRFTSSRPDREDGAGRVRAGLLARVGRKIASLATSLAMFLASCREFGILKTLATLLVFARLVASLARKTGHFLPAMRFAHSRHFQSQVAAPRGADLVFITSVPYTFGQNPWVIEIEDPTSLFYPYVQNGKTCEGDVSASPFYKMVRAMLEADACRGIVTHMRSTAEAIPALFKSETIANKVAYAPLGVRLPKRWQTHDDDDTVNLLFTNSWHQNPDGFFLRGGLDVLEAYWILHARYPQVRLTLRSAIPHMDERYMKIIQNCWVRVIDKFTPAKRMDELQRESHVFLLPAARIHIVSVLQAMSYGQAVVVSDGWGMEEYVTDGETGVVVPGRAGKVSWMDRAAGVLREDYRPMYSPDPVVVEGLVESVSRLIEERSLRRRLGKAARKAVETTYTIDRWNAALTAAFDKARGRG